LKAQSVGVYIFFNGKAGKLKTYIADILGYSIEFFSLEDRRSGLLARKAIIADKLLASLFSIRSVGAHSLCFDQRSDLILLKNIFALTQRRVIR